MLRSFHSGIVYLNAEIIILDIFMEASSSSSCTIDIIFQWKLLVVVVLLILLWQINP